ncbi:hypothetical protein [Bacillus sp. FJAT-42315]|uniref:hypothetical protein n=1 Tax=Bacillus sp. FJAT-42315 TaxID=2014077 RepID=UPI000C244825|nr:hypothetical protein [Bacillus sp. FJAT-42315]
MKRNRIVFVVTAIILVVTTVLLSRSKPLYGNDNKSIKNVIQSIEGYEHQAIELIEVKDVGDERVAGFLANGDPAYIQFSKNEEGNYEWNHVEKSESQSFVFYPISISSGEAKTFICMIVTNEKSDLAKMVLTVNGKQHEQLFNANEKSVTVIELPKAKNYEMTIDYYDKQGNVINEWGDAQ